MFDRIAPFYDLMNTVMTGGTDARWRRSTVASLRLRPGNRVLDVATGTGKLALAASERVGPAGVVIGLDASAGMLARAARAHGRHAADRGFGAIEWVVGDAMSMPFADAAFDAVSIGFGLRNLPDFGAGLTETARVLRPGGRLAILEISVPRSSVGRLLFATWFRRIIPLLGRLIGRHRAYSYLPASLDRYPPPEDVAGLMRERGFEQVSWRWLPSGFATLHVGVRGEGA